MKKMVFALAFLFSIVCFSFAWKYQHPPQDGQKPLNVILLIGDGMGLGQISAGYYLGEQPSQFTRFPFIGLMDPSSSNHKITDSAAGATAIACGKKSYNGAIGVDSNGVAMVNLVEILEKHHYQSGLISTSSITHATPASFFAHAAKRSLEEEIAAQLHTSGVDFIAGGGRKFFTDREDGLNYLDSLSAYGYQIETDSLGDASKTVFLLADDGLPPAHEGRRGDFLSQSVDIAIRHLSKGDNGFFLMVEGSQIDWGGHDNNAEYILAEMNDFNRAVKKAVDFSEKNGNTLVIVTADHETGGLTLKAGEKTSSEGKTKSDYNQLVPAFSTGGHTASLIPVFATGPQAERFAGVYANTGIFYRILEALEIQTEK